MSKWSKLIITKKELNRLHDYYADLCDRNVHDKYAWGFYAGVVSMLNDLLGDFGFVDAKYE